MKQEHPVATAATPLRSLTAIALDTETTSLDVRHARILEIGAIAILKGRLVPELHFASLVNPHAAIPPESVAIHGITDDARKIAGQLCAGLQAVPRLCRRPCGSGLCRGL